MGGILQISIKLRTFLFVAFTSFLLVSVKGIPKDELNETYFLEHFPNHDSLSLAEGNKKHVSSNGSSAVWNINNETEEVLTFSPNTEGHHHETYPKIVDLVEGDGNDEGKMDMTYMLRDMHHKNHDMHHNEPILQSDQEQSDMETNVKHMVHDKMDHDKMDHGKMVHGKMDHDKMDHDKMDHDKMDHDKMDHDDMDNKHVGMDMNGTGMHSMMMYFHFGVDQVVLFKGWKISTVGGMIGSVIGIFLLGMVYEGLKYFREHLFKKYVSSIQFSTVAVTGESGRVTQVHKVERHVMMSWPHAVQTSLHVIQIVMSYFLMLIFMTYNFWLCFAVVLGSGFGYFIFGWKKASVVDITEHCH